MDVPSAVLAKNPNTAPSHVGAMPKVVNGISGAPPSVVVRGGGGAGVLVAPAQPDLQRQLLAPSEIDRRPSSTS